VIIPVVADMPARYDSYIAWRYRDRDDVHTLDDGAYVAAIVDARKAGLLPILELQIRQQDPKSSPDDSAALVGVAWANSYPYQSLSSRGPGSSKRVGTLEKQWFDNYTAFAVHYAQISATHKLPYFIIGNGLSSASYDTDRSSYKNDPKGRDRVAAGEPACLNG